MAFQIFDRVLDTTTTNGTGTITLAGAVTGFNAMSTVLSNGDTVPYSIWAVDSNGVPSGAWETGLGTYTAAGTTLARTTVGQSSNAGAAVNFSAGTKRVAIDFSSSNYSITGRANGVPRSSTGTTLDSSWIGNVSAGMMTGYIYGFPMAIVNTAVVNVGFPNANAFGNVCRDKADAAFITLAAGQVSPVNVTTNGTGGGNDSFTGPGTVTVAGASKAVTGTSTTFSTSFGVRTCSGTITSSAATITGTGTLFLSEFAVNDLIGTTTSTKGFFRITAIASDSSMTISATPGSAFSGQTPKCIEQPTIKIDTNAVDMVDAIASDTALTTITNQSAQTTKTYVIGRPLAIAAASAAFFMYVWISAGTSGTIAYASTQRTTPFGITGYTTSVRRIGWLLLKSNGDIVPHDVWGVGPERWYQIENDSTGTTILNAGTGNAAWTAVAFNTLAPPTATAIQIELECFALQGAIQVRARNAGVTDLFRRWEHQSVTGALGLITPPGYAACDGAQFMDWVMSNATTQGFIYYTGCQERL